MEKKDFVYEGKAKRLFTTDDPEILLVEYKDSFTAFNGVKKATMEGKGVLNNKISTILFEYLKSQGVNSHFIKQLDETHQLVKKVSIVPLEVIVRNITTGSLCKRIGVEEGIILDEPLIEFSYKNDDLGDPLIIEDYAVAFGWATRTEVNHIKEISLQVNKILGKFFKDKGITLVDFKLEFGKDSQGNLILADEISPDTCRFWDNSTGDHLDKDRFRKDLGNVLDAYREILKRITEE